MGFRTQLKESVKQDKFVGQCERQCSQNLQFPARSGPGLISSAAC